MMAKKRINQELKLALSKLMDSTGKGDYSAECDELLLKIKHLNKTLNSKKQLEKIDLLIEKVTNNDSKIKEIESCLKNEEFYYKLKKEVLAYPFSAKRTNFLRAIKKHKSFLEDIRNNGSIIRLNALYSEVEEIQASYCYHLILKNLFNPHSSNKEIVKEIVFYKTASMGDLVDDDIIEDFFSMIILNKDQLSNIKRCFYYTSNSKLTSSKIDEMLVENEWHEEKIKSFIYEKNETYSF